MLVLNLFSIPPFISAIIIIGIGFFVIYKNPLSRRNQALLLFCLCLFFWLTCYGAAYNSSTPEGALKWARRGFIAVAFIAYLFCNFTVIFLKAPRQNFVLGVLFASSVILALLSQTELIYDGVDQFFWGYYPTAGPLYGVFIAIYVATWLYCLWLVYMDMENKKKAGDFLSYNRLKYVFFAWLGGTLGVVDYLPKYGVPVYPFAYIVALYWVLTLAFVISRYRVLADISFITRKLLIGSAFFMAMASIFGLSYLMIDKIGEVFSLNEVMLTVVAAVGLGLICQPLYRYVRKIIDRSFFPEHCERDERVARLGQDILLTKDMVDFSRIIMESLVSSFKVVKASVFVWSKGERAFTLQAGTGWGPNRDEKSIAKMTSNDPIPKAIFNKNHLLLDDLRRDSGAMEDSRSLELILLQMGANVCIPIQRGTNLLGFFVLGDKESGLAYDPEDIKALKNIAKHTFVALENIDLKKRWNEGEVERKQMDKLFHRYMSASVADEVLKMVDQDAWAGERRYVTVLMADLRGFTSTSEVQEPEEVVQCLNEYFSELVEIILSYGGTVDKFMGDAVMVIFGAPKPIPDQENRAVRCAIDMQARLRGLNEKRKREGRFSLEMGIGISAGDVVAGNIGSDKRTEYTFIGDCVNIASRLQSVAEGEQILATVNVVEKVADQVDFIKREPITLKGRSEPLEIGYITGLKPDEKSKLTIEDIPEIKVKYDDKGFC